MVLFYFVLSLPFVSLISFRRNDGDSDGGKVTTGM
jgi:hypothetical protein